MFETFNVPGLYIGVQAVLALYAGFAAGSKTGKVRYLSAALIGRVWRRVFLVCNIFFAVWQ